MHINKLKRTVCKSYEFITELADSLEAPPRFELGHKGFAVPENCLIEYLLFQKLKVTFSFFLFFICNSAVLCG